ncbi:ABC transporter ATP-binding protein [Brucella sp. NBRC 12950]|uniref:dipeptide ABC transporter ATP-binding protein n=1 Tax=Brucella sp. NBRC 12950 TaxID=2994518 RepID=UPI0024A10E93|nr:ABC transporter ATP-binding protein [Brucella sp. NBRC 12950]GLU29153.1 ABC transporter ATP-binding protein [Brucella sp. NBRC 12950]
MNVAQFQFKTDISSEPVLRVSNLQVNYTRTNKPVAAVKKISFEINSGEVVALVGGSGSGKTTAAHAVIGLRRESATIAGGSIAVLGQDVTSLSQRELASIRGRLVGYVPQDPGVSLNPVQRIGSQVAEILSIHQAVKATDIDDTVLKILSDVGLRNPEQVMRKYPHELSGGMQQRVLIAIAVACNPKIIIADEPTSALDVTVQKQILDLLSSFAGVNRTAVLLITHDLAVAAQRADRIIVMQEGEIVEIGDAQQIIATPQHPYTRSLINAAPGFMRRKSRCVLPKNNMRMPYLQLLNINKTFNGKTGGKTVAVDEVSLSVYAGTTFGLVGESGSGKTTMARIAAQLERASSGRVLIGGRDISALRGRDIFDIRRNIQFVHQNPFSSLDPRFNVAEIIMEPLRAFSIGSRKDQRNRAEELLAQVALDHSYLSHRPRELSGGQRQRVAIARALALQPELIILDEPVSALDVLVQDQILRLLQRLQQQMGLTYLFISHDLAVIRQLSDHVGVMQNGKLVEVGLTEDLFSSPKHPYTKQLLDAIPEWTRA